MHVTLFVSPFFHHYHRRDREKVDSFSMRQHWSSEFMFIAELNSMFEMVSKFFMKYLFFEKYERISN